MEISPNCRVEVYLIPNFTSFLHLHPDPKHSTTNMMNESEFETNRLTMKLLGLARYCEGSRAGEIRAIIDRLPVAAYNERAAAEDEVRQTHGPSHLTSIYQERQEPPLMRKYLDRTPASRERSSETSAFRPQHHVIQHPHLRLYRLPPHQPTNQNRESPAQPRAPLLLQLLHVRQPSRSLPHR